ncbi:hypothetical protein SMUL_1857 [Sulfurospirillum multivorans DSM 12446]|uniref:Uncharacterized protein n=2 Tax=Sulfurospirillum multivorans TaxID=66821 RepID=A0AA86ANQ6_SULMK|nr:hypothetical protein SMUL_1857 [Sulfurospirillum multivorans DSM 12446]
MFMLGLTWGSSIANLFNEKIKNALNALGLVVGSTVVILFVAKLKEVLISFEASDGYVFFVSLLVSFVFVIKNQKRSDDKRPNY